MSVGSVVRNRLKTDTAVNNAVDGKILRSYRDNINPAIVFAITETDTQKSYQNEGLDAYELLVACIAKRYAEANEIADLVKTRLDGTSWTDGSVNVLGCFYETSAEEVIEATDNTDKLAVIDLRFYLDIRIES
jgi:hypothetical protein